MAAFLHLRAIRERYSAAGKALNDRFDRTTRIVRQRIEPEDRLRRRCIYLLVRADGQSERVFEARHGLPYALAFRSTRIEQEQTAIGAVPASHARDHELLVAWDLDDGPRKSQIIFLAGNQSGAKPLLHVDLDFGEGYRPTAATVRFYRVAALLVRA